MIVMGTCKTCRHWNAPMALFELGEHAAFLLSPFGRIVKCRCEARRRWLNVQGERLAMRLWPRSHENLLVRFSIVIIQTLRRRVVPAPELHAKLRRCGIRISYRTMERWLAPFPVASLVISGVKHYGMAADNP